MLCSAKVIVEPHNKSIPIRGNAMIITVSQPNRQVEVFHGRNKKQLKLNLVLPLTIFAMPTR